MFTAYDDSTIAKWCLTHGASGYFVKETTEKEGRNSVRAFEDLKKTVDGLVKFSDATRILLWRNFSKFEECVDNLAKPKGKFGAKPEISWNLRMAFYWLFSTENNLKIRNQRANNIGVHAMEAFWELLKFHYYINVSPGEEKPWLNYTKGLRVRDLIRNLNLDDIFPEKNLLKEFNSIRTEIVHAHLVDLEFEKTIHLFNYIIFNVKKYCEENNLKTFSKITERNRLHYPDAILSQINVTLENTDASSLSHPKISAHGAIDFVKGWKEAVGISGDDKWATSNERETLRTKARRHLSTLTTFSDGFGRDWLNKQYDNYKILYIDDNPDDWEAALKVVFGEDGVVCKKYSKTDNDLTLIDEIKFNDYDLILLDLRMPDPEDGHEILIRIKEKCLSVPVVMLTSSDEAGWTRDCLNDGADNYFLKRIPDDNKKEATVQFANMVQTLIENFGKNTKSRIIWEKLEILKIDNWEIGNDQMLMNACDFINWKDSSLTDVKNCIIGLCNNILLAYIGTYMAKYETDNKIDVNRWILNGLSNPRYGKKRKQSLEEEMSSYNIILALECGKLIEKLVQLEVAILVKSDVIESDKWDKANMIESKQILVKNLAEGYSIQAFNSVVDNIWKERNFAARAELGKNAQAIANPEIPAENAIDFATQWLHRFKGRLLH